MEEKDNKNLKNFQEQKEEKEFLSRQEIKTMQKDISRIREGEAEKERGRIAALKTSEEAKKERGKQELAQREAEARKRITQEEQKKEEELIETKKEMEEKATIMEKQKAAATEFKTEIFRERFKETQTKEEEERKKFLERVKAQNESASPPPAPTVPLTPPPPPEKPKEQPLSELKTELPQKPSFFERIWVRAITSILILVLMGGIATFWYWFFVIREPVSESPVTEEPIEEELIIPPALIAVEDLRTLTVSSLGQTLQEELEENRLRRLVITDSNEKNVLSLQGFFTELGIEAPEGFHNNVLDDFTLFVYSQPEGKRLGMVAKTSDESSLREILTNWEPTMENDLANFFELMDKNNPALVAYFKNGESEGTAFRYQTFSRQDLGIVYTVFNDYFILTASWKSMEKTLQKLKTEPVSFLPFSPAQGAEFVLRQLTLQEKIGQLFLIGINNETLDTLTWEFLNNVQPGGILLLKYNIDNSEQVKELTDELQKTSLSYSSLPLLISADQEGNPICRVDFLEEKTSQCEIANPEQAYQVGLERGEELKKLGINLNLAPVLDLTQPNDFLFARSFQKDLASMGELAKSLILGQKEADILTAIKHFPGYSEIAFNPEKNLAVLDNMPETYHFQKVMESKPELVMTSNVVYQDIDPDLPFAFSKKGIELLKEKLGNGCLIITDDLPQNYLLNNFSLKDLVILPIEAGVDILMFSGSQSTIEEAVQILYGAVQNGAVSEERINQSVLKIIQLKETLL